jgi:hypothetical protein
MSNYRTRGCAPRPHNHVTVRTGTNLGMVIAVIISWMKWHSIGWAIVHGLFGWCYVFYYLIMGY